MLLGVAFVLLSGPLAAAKVRVLAATQIEARVERDLATSNGVVLRGILRDDVGAPIPNSHVAISIHGEGGRGPALPLPRAERCEPSTAPGPHDPHLAPDEYVVDTDATGSFCLRSPIAVDRGVARLRFQGGAFYESSGADIPFERSHPATNLAFDPPPQIVSLDRPLHLQGVRVQRVGLGRGDWHLTLRDERQHVVGRAIADEDGYARIEVRTEDLAGPGAGSWVAALDNTSVSTSHPMERHARVDLALESAEPEGNPEDGIAMVVHASSLRGDAPTGVVEITVGDKPVGAARVQAGRAAPVARFGAGRAKTATAQLRYLSDTPWWEPGAPLTVTLRIRPPNPWRRAPLVLLALAVAAWLARAPLLARWHLPRAKLPRQPLLSEHQEMQVVRARGESGDWAGRVFDAHDGSPLSQAKVSVVVPGFPGASDDGVAVIAAAATSESGRFALAASAFREGARLRIEAPLHATFEEPLPPPAELAIPLVSRRRRLLERLVQWATREWGPGALADPTPGQIIARAAADVPPGDLTTRERADRVRTWARAVERAAFDRAAVDERVEREVVAREPRPQGSYEDVIAVTRGALSAGPDKTSKKG